MAAHETREAIGHCCKHDELRGMGRSLSNRLDSPWVLLLIVAISYLPFITPPFAVHGYVIITIHSSLQETYAC